MTDLTVETATQTPPHSRPAVSDPAPAGVGRLADALAQAQAKFGIAELDSTNPHFNSKYASLASVMRAIQPHLGEAGVALLQFPEIRAGEVWLTTRLIHSSGEQLECQLYAPIPDGKSNPVQRMAGVLSYLKRYALSAMLGVATGDDDDGNSADGNSRYGKSSQPDRHPTQPDRRPANTAPRASREPHPAQSSRDQHPSTEEMPQANRGQAPRVPTPKQRDNPMGYFCAVAAEKGLSDDEQRALLGVDSRADAVKTPERLIACAQGLESWGTNELNLVRDAINATDDSQMKGAWMGLPEETRDLLTPALKFRKQTLIDAGLWGILADADEGLDQGKCKGCGASMWWGRADKTEKPVPLDRPIRRALEPSPDFPQEQPKKIYVLGPDEKMHLVDTWSYREGDDWCKGYMPHHATCPKAEEFRSSKEAA